MKKLLKNKNICIILSVIDLALIIILFKYNLLFVILYLLFNLLVFSLILKIYLNVSLFNFDKIKNIYLTKKIRSQIDSEERYVKKMNIKTFDGSGGTTHPCIIYFENGFNGYKYWMVHTPYDNENVTLENPSICVSNDRINFIKPNGINDPLLPIIQQCVNEPLKYYNDPFFLYDNNKLQVWYRYTIEDKIHKDIPLKNYIYRITSNNGIDWSQPELMMDDDGIWYLSPSIVKINNLYYFYYFDKDLKFYCKTSSDLKKWDNPNLITINEFKGNFWHGEVKLVRNKLYVLFLSKDSKLYFCESDKNNPYIFNSCIELHFNYYDKSNVYGNIHKYKTTFLIDENYINFYIPYRVNVINWFKLNGVKHIKWTMTNTFIKKMNYDRYIIKKEGKKHDKYANKKE